MCTLRAGAEEDLPLPQVGPCPEEDVTPGGFMAKSAAKPGKGEREARLQQAVAVALARELRKEHQDTASPINISKYGPGPKILRVFHLTLATFDRLLWLAPLVF